MNRSREWTQNQTGIHKKWIRTEINKRVKIATRQIDEVDKVDLSQVTNNSSPGEGNRIF